MDKTSTSEQDILSAIGKCDRTKVLKWLKDGKLAEIAENQKDELCAKIIGLRDMQIVDALAKKTEHFTPQMLQLDYSNWRNREFANDVLCKYKKKFDCKDAAVYRPLFELSCVIGNTKLLRSLVKQKKAVDLYARLAESSDSVYRVLAKADVKSLNADTIVEILLAASFSENPTERLKELSNWGYLIETANSEGRNVVSLFEEKQKKMSYPSNKKGELLRNRDKNTLLYLKKMLKEKSEPKQKNIRLYAICGCAAIVIAITAFSLAYHSITDNSTSDDETAESIADTESLYDESTESSYTTDYNADTSLVVADGDTVNIDYTGYVDGVAFENGSTNGVGADLVIGSGSYIDDFEEQLIGANVGDEVEVVVTFPEDYGNEDLNGKEATFEVTINGIYE